MYHRGAFPRSVYDGCPEGKPHIFRLLRHRDPSVEAAYSRAKRLFSYGFLHAGADYVHESNEKGRET